MKRIIFIVTIFALALSVNVKAQTKTLVNAASTTSSTVTVTDTGTGALVNLLAVNSTSGTKVSIQVVATKTSGTVAGTISLQGSIDGTNFKAILLEEVATAVNTYTATDVASQTFIWRLASNPYPYYKVSWTGTGTMVAVASAKLFIR